MDKSGSFDKPFLAEVHERFQLPPDQFIESQNQLEERNTEQRERMVYADSIECAAGYNSLIRLLSHHFVRQVAYTARRKVVPLSLDEARAAAYRKCEDEEQAKQLFDRLMSIPADWISFADLSELNSFSKAMAENVWEIIKR